MDGEAFNCFFTVFPSIKVLIIIKVFVYILIFLIEEMFLQFSFENCNPGENSWNKIEKSSKTGQDKKSSISTFTCFLTATAKVEFVEGRLGTRLCLPPNLRFS